MSYPLRVQLHLFRHKHTIVRENRNITVPMFYLGHGWLFVCECGKAWAY